MKSLGICLLLLATLAVAQDIQWPKIVSVTLTGVGYSNSDFLYATTKSMDGTKVIVNCDVRKDGYAEKCALADGATLDDLVRELEAERVLDYRKEKEQAKN